MASRVEQLVALISDDPRSDHLFAGCVSALTRLADEYSRLCGMAGLNAPATTRAIAKEFEAVLRHVIHRSEQQR
jgi:hypothetical protein